jgi:16S rRNA (uracil1498-N3)-methyltransferase
VHRFFVAPEDLRGEKIVLPTEVLHHLSVLRSREGEEILLLDGTGLVCRCRIASLGRRDGTAHVTAKWVEEESPFRITLLQGIPKGDKMDLILQKGTELGISRFVPVLTGRSIPTPGGGKEGVRLERWGRIVREAARQCRRPRLPLLDAPLPLAGALADRPEELRLFLWEEESCPLAAILPEDPPRDAVVLVGPEGGFSSEEAEAAARAGFIAVRLGPRILRSETAGFVVASILQHRYGDLGATRGDDPQDLSAPPKENP